MIEGKRPGFIIFEDDNHMAILDKYPIDTGHSLVLPKIPYEKITEMPKNDVAELFSLVPEIANAILKATGAVAFSIAQNNGKEAKQIIPHVHVHIIPRYADKATLWTKRRIPSDDELEELRQKIKNSF
ncbi:MAG: HIT domain-containing protein [Candidatus Nitrosopelagicus sp.]|nr:HIT domain-containing protein [Candidatus Nitrosopelagicus sp.]MBT3762092.1 HIT domain-containing protein [Candidatus Nitrosopelagicus sp.]MBT5171842.1 HIT domain-containing protein [Candidatus Nitrosopelagicus sp.]MBT7252446.1 HIT domain-containing protein [Candidatus Nitrosopelagicus sp.]